MKLIIEIAANSNTRFFISSILQMMREFSLNDSHVCFKGKSGWRKPCRIGCVQLVNDQKV